jgi:hypothetical protein
MIPGFGAHYRAYRVRIAIERLRAMPTGTTLSFAKAAHLLGAPESAVRAVVRRYGSSADAESRSLSAAALLSALRQAHSKQR